MKDCCSKWTNVDVLPFWGFDLIEQLDGDYVALVDDVTQERETPKHCPICGAKLIHTVPMDEGYAEVL